MLFPEGDVERIGIQSPEKSSGFFSGFKEKILEWRNALGNIVRPVIGATLAVASLATLGIGIYLLVNTPDVIKYAIGGSSIVGGVVLAVMQKGISPGGDGWRDEINP